MATPSRRIWPAVAALSLAFIAGGVLLAALLRGGAESPPGANRALIVRLLPRDTAGVRGIRLSSLGRTPLGRALAEQFSVSKILGGVHVACERPIDEAVDWMTTTRSRGDRLGDGTVLWGLRWDEDRVHRCLRTVSELVGSAMSVRAEGALRTYDFGEQRSLVAAWLDPRTVLTSSSWEPARQRTVLEELVGRTAPPADNHEIAELVERVDTGATLWLAMLRPRPEITGEADQSWLSDELASMLGATPDAIYAAVDVGESLRLDAGARYVSEEKAVRVARHVRDWLAIRRGGAVAGNRPSGRADLSNYPPAVRAAFERMLARTGSGSTDVRDALLGAVEVGQRGRDVTFTLSLSAATIERLLAARSPRQLIDEINGWLPDSLRIAL